MSRRYCKEDLEDDASSCRRTIIVDLNISEADKQEVEEYYRKKNNVDGSPNNVQVGGASSYQPIDWNRVNFAEDGSLQFEERDTDPPPEDLASTAVAAAQSAEDSNRDFYLHNRDRDVDDNGDDGADNYVDDDDDGDGVDLWIDLGLCGYYK